MPHRAGPAAAVEEDEIESKAHAEGVDAGAAWDQQPGARPIAVEMGKAKHPGVKADGDRNPLAEDVVGREAAQATGCGKWGHARPSPRPPRLSPRIEPRAQNLFQR